jgi:hypothetical protein
MFTIKKSQTAGVCQAMRCTKPAVDLLCPLHTKEWVDAGSPALTVAEKKAPAAGAGGALTEEEQAAMVLERDNQTKALALAEQFPLGTPEARDKLMGFVNQALERVKVLDAHRLEKTKGLRDTVAWINRIHNDVAEVYQKFADIAKGRIAAELLALEVAKREASKLIEANAGAAPAEAFLAAHIDLTGPKTGGGTRIDYEFKVTDPSLLPDWCWMKVLDRGVIQGKIDAAAAIGREPESIPGLTITKKLTLIKGAA